MLTVQMIYIMHMQVVYFNIHNMCVLSLLQNGSSIYLIGGRNRKAAFE